MSKKSKKKNSQNKTPEASMLRWDCKCGEKNIKTNFCPECGAKRPKSTSEGKSDTITINKKTLTIVLVSILAVLLVVGGVIAGVTISNNNDNKDNDEKTQMLSFSQATSIEAMKALDGKKVSIIGYMSTLSPVNGSFMYLMNLPYQSCPFCIPNTTQLSNTLAVYAKNGSEFEFTDRTIQVTGIMEFGKWTDEFGYTYEYRIKDATFEVLNTDNMSDELKQWQALASADVIGEVYTLYNIASYLCFWPEYIGQFGSTNDYLYPEDVKKEFAQGGYYSEYLNDMYYDDLIIRIETVDPNAFSDLTSNIKKVQAFIKDVYKDLTEDKYVKVPEYTNAFGDGRQQYKYERYVEFTNVFDNLYFEFATWMAKWEV